LEPRLGGRGQSDLMADWRSVGIRHGRRERVPVGVCPVSTLSRTDRIIGMTEVICIGSEMESSLSGAGPSPVSWSLALVLSSPCIF